MASVYQPIIDNDPDFRYDQDTGLFTVVDEFSVTIGSLRITVPPGYTFDGASVPQEALTVSSLVLYLFAAVTAVRGHLTITYWTLALATLAVLVALCFPKYKRVLVGACVHDYMLDAATGARYSWVVANAVFYEILQLNLNRFHAALYYLGVKIGKWGSYIRNNL